MKPWTRFASVSFLGGTDEPLGVSGLNEGLHRNLAVVMLGEAAKISNWLRSFALTTGGLLTLGPLLTGNDPRDHLGSLEPGETANSREA